MSCSKLPADRSAYLLSDCKAMMHKKNTGRDCNYVHRSVRTVQFHLSSGLSPFRSNNACNCTSNCSLLCNFERKATPEAAAGVSQHQFILWRFLRVLAKPNRSTKHQNIIKNARLRAHPFRVLVPQQWPQRVILRHPVVQTAQAWHLQSTSLHKRWREIFQNDPSLRCLDFVSHTGFYPKENKAFQWFSMHWKSLCKLGPPSRTGRVVHTLSQHVFSHTAWHLSLKFGKSEFLSSYDLRVSQVESPEISKKIP